MDMTDTVEMLNCIDTGSSSKGLFSKLVRISASSINTICRGSIGGSNGLRFCTKSDCRIASHKHKVEIDVTSDMYFIGGAKGGQAYTEPNVPVMWISEPTEQVQIETLEKPLSVWKLFFKQLEASVNDCEGVKSTDAGFEAIKELADIDTAKAHLKTPKRSAPINLLNI